MTIVKKSDERKPEELFMRNFKTLAEKKELKRQIIITYLGVKEPRYHAWTDGRAFPPLYYKFKIAELLETPLIKLLTEDIAA